MNIPGSNLYGLASRVITAQSINYYAAIGRTQNSVGQYVTTYAAPVVIRGSMQPVARSMYTAYGLDFQKSYYILYTDETQIQDLQRDKSVDKATYANKTLKALSNNPWFPADGWNGTLWVVVENDS